MLRALAPIALLAACGGPAPQAIESGQYQFYTLAVDDACLDGAMEAIFMPEGRETEHPFEFPIFVPSPELTPISYSVDFREPFVGMPVTVDAVEGGLAIRGSVMDAVRLDQAQYGDCDVTMSVDADLGPSDEPKVLIGEARIAVSNPRGEEGRCPVLDADPCAVTLQIRADWLSAATSP